jgi:TetR/AcrR family transcriptional regulator, cholesterol catabolism regulator
MITSRREANKLAKQARILEAARKAFRENGFELTTLKQVAEDAGVGHGTLFLYAPTKEALLVQVYRTEMEQTISAAFAHMPATDIRAQIGRMFAAVIDHNIKDPELFRPFLREVQAGSGQHVTEVRNFIRHWRGRIETLLEAAVQRGELPPEADAKLIATCLLDIFMCALRRWIDGDYDQLGRDTYLKGALNLLLAGCRNAAVAERLQQQVEPA